jgi:glutaredoxin 3
MSLQEQLQKQINETKVMIYSKTWCPYCINAKNLLRGMGVEFKVLELDKIKNGREIQNTLIQMTNWYTVPSIFIGGVHV